MQFLRTLTALVALTALTLTSVLTLSTGTAHACSCASVDAIDAVAMADIAFTGVATANNGDEFNPVWQFAIDGVIKGEVSSAETVIGENWGSGCGNNFAQYREAIVVYAAETSDGLQALGCMPAPTAAEFTSLLEAVGPPSGTGPPAALMSGTFQGTDFAVLDDQGRTVARTSLGTSGGAVAHCAGTSLAAVVTSFPNDRVLIVDLTTLEVIDERPTSIGFVSIVGDRVACLDGGSTIVTAIGNGPDTGQLQVAASSASGGEAGALFDEFSRAVLHPAGTVLLLPRAADTPIRVVRAADLSVIEDVHLTMPAGASTLDGDVSPDGSQLAALATLSGRDVSWNTGGTHVILIDVADGQPTGAEPTVIEIADAGANIEAAAGAAKWIRWVDNSSFVIESETVSDKRIRIMQTDGTVLVDNIVVPWGWGLAPIPSGVLRTTNGGIQVVASDGTTADGDPAPDKNYIDRSLWLAPLVNAPDFVPVGDDAAQLEIRPVAAGTSIDRPGASDATGAPSSDRGWVVPLVAVVAVAAIGGSLVVFRRKQPT